MANSSPLSQSLIKSKSQLLEKLCLMGVRLDLLTAKVHTEVNHRQPKATAGHFYFSSIQSCLQRELPK